MTLTDAIVLIVAVFAVYRVSKMAAQEDGPFDIFSGFRARFTGNNWFSVGIRCVYCVSFWVALLFSLMLVWRGTVVWADVPLVWPALSGGAIVVEKYWRN